MPKKTKVALERELKEARKHLKDIVDCFERKPSDECEYNMLLMKPTTIENLDIALDAARAFLK